MPFNLAGLLTDALAGIAGGAVAVLVGQPLDTVKVKMQLYPSLYGSIASCVTKTVREQGFRGLYTGISPALVSNCGENAILFGAYGQCQNLVAAATGHDTSRDDAAEPGLAHNAAAGAIASVFTSLVMCPSELVKIRMHGFQGIEVNPNEPDDVTASRTIKNIWKADGFRGLYRGFWATLARESVSCSVFFASYEWFRHQYGAMVSDDGGNAATTVATASTATAVTWLTVYPVDVVKSRLQRFAKVAERGDRPIWQQARVLGLRTLYRGLWPSLVKTVPVSGLLMYTVEYTKTVLRKPTPPPSTDSRSGPVLANPTPSPPESSAPAADL